MKKVLCALLAVACLVFAVGCEKQETEGSTESSGTTVTFYQAIGGLERLHVFKIEIEDCQTGEVRSTEDGGRIYNVYDQLKDQAFRKTGSAQREQIYSIELFDENGGSVRYTFDKGFEARDGYTKTVTAGNCAAENIEQMGYILSMFFNGLPSKVMQSESVQ